MLVDLLVVLVQAQRLEGLRALGQTGGDEAR